MLAAIAVVGATHRVGLTAVILTAAFAVGTAVPLLAVAAAGGQLTSRIGAIRRRAPQIRRIGGAVLVVFAVLIASDVLAGLQRDIPGYTTALQGSPKIRKQLKALTGTPHTTLSKCDATAITLVNCGPAPDFKGITAWLNTPGGQPLSLSSLRGKVVLVDFWTYSCINCQRSLPHVAGWYSEYAKDGFVVVGVHTPEFAFEHVVSNVKAQAAALGVHYPVAVDDNYATWNAYSNQYWPADYLIDAQGNVRSVHFGEGDYATMGTLIQQLLKAAHPSRSVPAAAGVPDKTPTGELSPETYLGYSELQYLDPPEVARDTPAAYHFPASLPLGALGLAGTWTDHAEEATAGPAPSWNCTSWPRTCTWCSAVPGRSMCPWTGSTRRPSTSAGRPGCTRCTRRARLRPGRLRCVPRRGSRRTTSPSARLLRRAIRRRSGRPAWRAGRAAGRRWR